MTIKPSFAPEVTVCTALAADSPDHVLHLLLQPWYAALEEMQYLLPDEDSREKVAAESWSLKVDRLKEGTLAVRSHSCYQSGCERLPGLSGPSALLCMFGRAQQCAAFSRCVTVHRLHALCSQLQKIQDGVSDTSAICRSLKQLHGSARRPCLQSRTASGESYLNWTTLSQLCRAAQTWQQWPQSMSR